MTQTDQRTAFEVWARTFSGAPVEIAVSSKKPLSEMNRAELLEEIRGLNSLLKIANLARPPILIPDGMRIRTEQNGLWIVERVPAFGLWARVAAWWRTESGLA